MKFTRILMTGLAALPAGTIAADSIQLTPGRWIETATPESITVGDQVQDISPGDTKTKSLCLSAAEGADPRKYFAVAEQNALCTPPIGTVAGGKIALGNHCAKDPAKADSQERELEINGTYGAESYAAKAVMTTSFGNAPVVIQLAIAGHFDGACHGDEDPRTGPAK